MTVHFYRYSACSWHTPDEKGWWSWACLAWWGGSFGGDLTPGCLPWGHCKKAASPLSKPESMKGGPSPRGKRQGHRGIALARPTSLRASCVLKQLLAWLPEVFLPTARLCSHFLGLRCKTTCLKSYKAPVKSGLSWLLPDDHKIQERRCWDTVEGHAAGNKGSCRLGQFAILEQNISACSQSRNSQGISRFLMLALPMQLCLSTALLPNFNGFGLIWDSILRQLEKSPNG